MVSKKDLESIIILTGPTASGKTQLALHFAERYPRIEILNADSLLVYRMMNIGTAKPNAEDLNRVPHHLIDIRNPDETFTAGEFYRAAQSAIQEIHQRDKRVLIVGGTGFYLKALLFGLWNVPAANPLVRSELEKRDNEELLQELNAVDPDAARRIGLSDRYRLIRSLELYRLTGKTPTLLQSEHSKEPDSRFKLCIVDRPQADLLLRIGMRTRFMLEKGLVEEVKSLRTQFPTSRALKSVGYAQTCQFLDNASILTPPGRKVSPGIDGLNEEIQLATRQLVKQQRTWFRNQSNQIPQARWYSLDEDLSQLEVEFKTVYGIEERNSP